MKASARELRGVRISCWDLEPRLKLQFDEEGLGCQSEGAWRALLFKGAKSFRRGC